MKSWKTTASGIAAALVAIGNAASALLDNDPTTNPDWAAVVAVVIACVGLIAARDNGVTSEQAGAK